MPSSSPVAGRYRLEQELGRGTFGAVHRAFDLQLQRPVAIKLLRLTHGEVRARERFQREAAAAASLSHPGLVPVYDSGTSPEHGDFIVYELMSGGDLRQRVRAGDLGPEEVEAWARQTAAALQVVHQAGLVHRDLKPANLFLDAGRSARVGDLGLVLDSESTRLTATGNLVGSPWFMAPEVLQGRASAPAADQFGWAASFLWIAAGGQIGEELREGPGMAALEGASPLAVRDLVRVGTPRLARTLARCLRSDPEDRFPDMDAAVRSLDADASGAGRRSAGSAAFVTTAAEAGGGYRGRWRGLATLAAVGLVAGFSLRGRLGSRAGGPPPVTPTGLLATAAGTREEPTRRGAVGPPAHLALRDGVEAELRALLGPFSERLGGEPVRSKERARRCEDLLADEALPGAATDTLAAALEWARGGDPDPEARARIYRRMRVGLADFILGGMLTLVADTVKNPFDHLEDPGGSRPSISLGYEEIREAVAFFLEDLELLVPLDQAEPEAFLLMTYLARETMSGERGRYLTETTRRLAAPQQGASVRDLFEVHYRLLFIDGVRPRPPVSLERVVEVALVAAASSDLGIDDGQRARLTRELPELLEGLAQTGALPGAEAVDGWLQELAREVASIRGVDRYLRDTLQNGLRTLKRLEASRVPGLEPRRTKLVEQLKRLVRR